MKFAVFGKVIALLSVFLLVSGFGFSSSAPEAWQAWKTHAPNDTRAIDHDAWDAFLKVYVKPGADGLNRFAYSKVSAADKSKLAGYIKAMEQVEVTTFNRGEQIAFWLNLYNAVTIKVILDHYPVKTIKDIDISGLFANGPWKKELVRVESTALSLDHIEHAILRPIWKDPRVHYGVNCASVGCPNLLGEAFTAKKVDEQLTANARAYVNSPRGVRISSSGKVSVSSIYSWFAHDFGNSEQAVRAHLLKYAGPELAGRLKANPRLSGTHYDWSLNE